MKYKIIKEYSNYFLCEHPKGYKECFLKQGIKVFDENGNTYLVKKETNYQGNVGLPPEKVNRNFNQKLID